jgi:hypothetical protein
MMIQNFGQILNSLIYWIGFVALRNIFIQQAILHLRVVVGVQSNVIS